MFLAGGTTARAQQELTLIAPNIIDDPIKELAKTFEAKTDIKVNTTIGAPVASASVQADQSFQTGA